MKSANGEGQTEELKNFEQSVFKSDFCIEKLKRELGFLIDAIHVALPHVKSQVFGRYLKLCALTPTGKT